MKIVILVLGIFGLFAQMFSGYIIPGILTASLAAIAIALIDFIFSGKIEIIKWVTIFLSVVAVLGAVYDVFYYYSRFDMPGNYYGGWFWSIPLCICLVVHLKQLFHLSAYQKRS